MNLAIYTRDLLDKHLLPELKEIARGLGIVPDGNKTRRETWVAALVGQPFPLFQSIECPECHGDKFVSDDEGSYVECPTCAGSGEDEESAPGAIAIQAQEMIEDSPANSPTNSPTNSPGVDRVQEPIEFPDLESAIAEINRLRAENDKLLELARSQSEKIRRAKDISPVEKPSFKRVFALAQEALLTISRDAGGWILSMGHLKRGFKRLRHIWDLLVGGDWYLMDLFDPPPPPTVPKPLFPPIYSRFVSVPFADDDLIDIWALGFAGGESSGRSPPGGDAMS